MDIDDDDNQPGNNVSGIVRGMVDVLSLVPLAESACKLADKLIECAENAKRHKKVCKQLSKRVKAANETIKANPPTSMFLEKQYKNYIAVLTETIEYVKEIKKPSSFSEKFKLHFLSFVNANDNMEYHRELISRIDQAIADLNLSIAIENSGKLDKNSGKLDENSGKLDKHSDKLDDIQASLNIMLLNKGVDVKYKKAIILDEKHFSDVNQSESRGSKRQIQKRIYKGVLVAQRKDMTKIESKEVERQAKILNELSKCRNIEQFYGVLLDKSDISIVTEWAEKGDLETYLRNTRFISWSQKVMFAKGISAALNFCHSSDIFHHDVRSSNVLLDENFSPKLSNFGLARFKTESSTSIRGQMKILRWTAPEKLVHDYIPYTKEMDVYSFGILMWEIAAQTLPYETITNETEVRAIVTSGEHPGAIPEDTPKKYADVMKSAWNQQHEFRPKIKAISTILNQLYNDYQYMPYENRPMSHEMNGNGSVNNHHNNNEHLMEITYIPATNTLPSWREALQLHDNKQYARAFPIFEEYAKSGDHVNEAKYLVGLYIFLSYDGIPKDELKASVYLRQSASASSPHTYTTKAQYWYSYVCLTGELYDKESGLEYLKRAADAGEKHALLFYGKILKKGEHDQPVDLKAAEDYFKRARALGHKDAARELRKLRSNSSSSTVAIRSNATNN
ncbi:12757_t:CDS:2 [Ambispora gerdemannii]|uniref:12757_t:CDS:1 n=1 Tax=Ambispora gerdemannii TaxID=144530 RepID=A0A9N8VTS3_9GLOM|nr:12757_t:CDS:2 [Ambispora gerdemannii]